MDIIASKHAVEYARKWVVDNAKGQLLFEFVTYCYRGHLYSFLFISFCDLIMYLLLGSPILALPTKLVRRSNVCKAVRILSAFSRKILKSGMQQLSKNSMYLFTLLIIANFQVQILLHINSTKKLNLKSTLLLLKPKSLLSHVLKICRQISTITAPNHLSSHGS